MTLHPLTTTDLTRLLPYFQSQMFRMSDYTAGFQRMWMLYCKNTFTEIHNCLIIHATLGGKTYFYYPLNLTGNTDEELAAIREVEKYCVLEEIPLRWTSVPEERLGLLTRRYGRNLTLTNPRTWRDYLYEVKDFVEYAGKHFSGQRNHVRKFQRLYPEAKFRPFISADLPAVMDFLTKFAERQHAKNSFIATEELKGSKILLECFDDLKFQGGLMEYEGNVIGVTLGSLAGETFVIHIEKALVDYEGIYPSIAQAFAKQIMPLGVKYINREDDAGDCGLRKSKLQYNPMQILDKYTIVPNRIVEELDTIPEIVTPRCVLKAVPDEDAPIYARLASDIHRNRYWGWDWRKDWAGEGDPRSQWFLDFTRQDFNKRIEVPLGIYNEDHLIGEVCFHNFTYDHTVELGVRLLPEAEGNGFATEAMRSIADYALCYWGLEKVTAKCFKENIASKAMLLASGLRSNGEDETFYYFIRTAKN
ncbi:MAG: GNAT family N-acetyltransferase [bacterium]|nr:GNAT family N-acetyltransferase [bacterium]